MQVTPPIILLLSYSCINLLLAIDGEEIGPEGVERFCFDLEVDPEDVSCMHMIVPQGVFIAG